MAILKLRAATDTLKEVAALYIALLLVSAAAFAWLEKQPFLDSLYWAATTATSVGYGDISAKTIGGKIVSVLLMHASLFVIAPLIVVRLIEKMNDDRDHFSHDEQERIISAVERVEARLDKLDR